MPTPKTIKPLPHRVFKRGGQGTFVYAPDISVFVQTEDYGVIDLSPYITSFSLQRNINAPSAFTCTFDNKFAKFDRVVRRMDRIVVFLKRIEHLQVFSGYISVAPWETIVPGDAMLQADCTLKRLIYTFWDPHSLEAQTLYPGQDNTIATSADGGAGAVMFRLLTTIAGWDKKQIQIQKIPEKWLTQASKILKAAEEEDLADVDASQVREQLMRLLDADGWLGPNADTGGGQDPSTTMPMAAAVSGGLTPNNGVDAKWYKLVGKKSAEIYPPGFSKLEFYSGFADSRLVTTGLYDKSNNPIRLRIDAAKSLVDLMEAVKKTGSSRPIVAAYLSFDEQKNAIKRVMKSNNNQPQAACESVGCPAGSSDHGWGTTIDFDSSVGSPDVANMNQYGWIQDISGDGTQNPNHWVFVGNYDRGYPAYTSEKDNPFNQEHRGLGRDVQFNWDKHQMDAEDNVDGQGDSAFNTSYFFPTFDPYSAHLTGKRAWINDEALIESVTWAAQASMRDFQSAPNGDFVAFFADRLGVYGKFPTMQVRDIEVVDFKLIITDRTLVTHLVSVGDFANPLEPNTGIDVDVLLNSGFVSVEQPQVMKLILGLDETPKGLGNWFLDKFGMRPRRQDNYNIRNAGFNWMVALHLFEEAWASQWQAMVQFTFMPELYPGMRIELADHGLGVYVESVTHQGSRTGGFMTNAVVSTPMRKVGDKWRLLKMEFDPQQYIGNEDEIPSDVGETISTGESQQQR